MGGKSRKPPASSKEMVKRLKIEIERIRKEQDEPRKKARKRKKVAED